MHIRDATSLDGDAIHSIYWSAFAEGERELVAKLAVNLLSEETTPHTISLVAESDGAVVGHVAFSPVAIENNNGVQGYILAPLAVKPEYQKRRIGAKLVNTGIQQLSDDGVDIVLVYGDPDYYGRFGFAPGAAEQFLPPYELQYAFGWQGLALSERGAATSPARIACVKSLNDPALW